MKIVIITGMSGAGKSTAANVIEDMGYYCIDNMPAELITNIVNLGESGKWNKENIAFVTDIRGETDFGALMNELDDIRRRGHECSVLFVNCSDEVLINRYKETRRLHPMSVRDRSIPLNEAIAKERELLASIKEKSDYIVDTTSSSAYQLRDQINAIYGGENSGITVNCMSFGFKYGAAIDADMVFDVRCLPNPYYEDSLRELTGLDKAVSEYVFSNQYAKEYYRRIESMIDYMLPVFARDGRKIFSVAFGCTGGKHRSVAFADRLFRHLRDTGINASLVNRDAEKKFKGDK